MGASEYWSEPNGSEGVGLLGFVRLVKRTVDVGAGARGMKVLDRVRAYIGWPEHGLLAFVEGELHGGWLGRRPSSNVQPRH